MTTRVPTPLFVGQDGKMEEIKDIPDRSLLQEIGLKFHLFEEATRRIEVVEAKKFFLEFNMLIDEAMKRMAVIPRISVNDCPKCGRKI